MREGDCTPIAVIALAALMAAGAFGCAQLMSVEEPILGDPVADASTLAATGTDEQGHTDAGSATPPRPPGLTPTGCNREPDDCPGPTYCNGGQRCVPGCKSDDDCVAISATAQRCNLVRHQCVACLSDDQCPGAQKCSPAGTCAERCDADGGSCIGGKTCCSGLCLDTQSDELNCGGCGVACDSTNAKATCAGGACQWTCAPGMAHCSSGNTGCETDLGGDPANCGGCGNACDKRTSLPSACFAGICTLTACGKYTGDCDGDPSNGCECACGKKNGAGSECCPGSVCFAGSCGADGNCH